jgi:hypothetical protein
MNKWAHVYIKIDEQNIHAIISPACCLSSLPPSAAFSPGLKIDLINEY